MGVVGQHKLQTVVAFNGIFFDLLSGLLEGFIMCRGAALWLSRSKMFTRLPVTREPTTYFSVSHFQCLFFKLVYLTIGQ